MQYTTEKTSVRNAWSHFMKISEGIANHMDAFKSEMMAFV